MNGSRLIAMGLLVFAALNAVDAGRAGESGTGAMWIAPELVEEAPASGEPCSQVASIAARNLVFETLEPGADSEPRPFDRGAHQLVNFEWNPATSELAFRTTTSSAVFNDLVLPVKTSAAIRPSCGSR